MANNDNSILVTTYIRKFIVENEEVSKLINTKNVFIFTMLLRNMAGIIFVEKYY